MSERAGFVAGAPLRRDTREVEGALVDAGRGALLPHREPRRDAAVLHEPGQRLRPLAVRLQQRRPHGRAGAMPTAPSSPTTRTTASTTARTRPAAKTLLRVARGRRPSRSGSPSRRAARASTASSATSTRASVGNQLALRGDERRPRARVPLRLDEQRALRLRAQRRAAEHGRRRRSRSRCSTASRTSCRTGSTRRFQMEYSTLVDGYKESELDPATGLGIFRLSSVPVDKPEPSEALRATTVWSLGLEPAIRLLSSTQLDRFRRGAGVEQETNVRGRRGAYFVQASVRAGDGRRRRTGCSSPTSSRTPARCARRSRRLAKGEALLSEVAGRRRARHARTWSGSWRAPTGCSRPATSCRPGATSPTCSSTSCAAASSTDGYRDLARRPRVLPAQGATARVAERQAAFVCRPAGDAAARPAARRAARERATPTSSGSATSTCRSPSAAATATRAGPGTGSPSTSRTRTASRVLNYQGNWRDIFQNWEALAPALPGLRREHDLQVRRRLDGRRLQPLPHRRATASTGRSSTRTTRGPTSATGATTRSSTC